MRTCAALRYCRDMEASQAWELETLQRVTETSDAELIRLAQECAQDSGLLHLGELTRVDADDLIRTLRQYRYFRQIEALDREAVAA